jgi:RND family efflux transporter MFP subunit
VTLALSAGLPALRSLSGLGSSTDGPLYEVRRGDFVRTVHAEGNLTAAEATQLGPPPRTRHSLKIAWLAPDGSRVREGDVVIRFDPTDMEKSLDEGESERAQSDSRISKQRIREDSAIRNLDRDAGMADLELDYAREFKSKDPEIFSRVEVIESEIDEQLAAERKDHAADVREIRGELAQVELDLLAIERRKAEIKVQEAREGLSELEVRAPHDGIFALKQRHGRVAEVGQMVWRGNSIAEIPRLEVMEAEVYVLEADAGGLEVDLPAKVSLEAHPGRVYDATIKKVDALAQPRFRNVPVQYFGVELELERTEPEVMKPGQRVNATLLLGERKDVVAVPRQAIFEHEGRTVVYARREGDFAPLEVELGPASLGRVVIESGLEQGERVALFDPTRPEREPATEEAEGESGPAGGLAGSLR